MKCLIIGMGEIGQAIEKVITDSRYGDQPDVQTLDLEQKEIAGPIDILHICFPYSDTFIADVKAYQDKFKALYTIVYSTVPIGTCRELGAFHSPVEGKHPDLAQSIKAGTRWIATSTGRTWPVVKYWQDIHPDVRVVYSTDFTEFLKLRSTAKYGINLVWTDYEKHVADKLGMDFELLREFDKDYNKLYKELDLPQFQRYILTPPDGRIGGHCIVPNAKLLDKQFPDDMLKSIIGMEAKDERAPSQTKAKRTSKREGA